MSDATCYYCVHVSNRASRRRGTGWVWSPPYATPREARLAAQAAVDAGDATLAFAVEVGPGVRRVMRAAIWPGTARRIILHYADLLDRLKESPP